MKALLDVNILITLFDENHQYHAIAKNWFFEFSDNPNNIWLSCAITQLGCVRIISTSSYPNSQKISDIQQKLSDFIYNTNHEFILSDISLVDTDLINWQHIQGNKQLTDTYLMALAKNHNASFISLDTKISPMVIKDFNSNQLITLL